MTALVKKVAKPPKVEKGVLHFNAEARLLQELGERLVAVPEVALVELIKNSYDADATHCNVKTRGKDFLTVSDDGHGMTLEQFQQFWMMIGTSHKAREATSPIFQRDLTGQKGIGRFAMRFLGTMLTVTTTAFDKKKNATTQLVATFDWTELDSAGALSKAAVPYTLNVVDESTPTGTSLEISGLRHSPKFIESDEFRTQVLKILSPLQGLDWGPFAKHAKKRSGKSASTLDPGFEVHLPGHDIREQGDVLGSILENYVARLTIEGDQNKVTYRIIFRGQSKPHNLVVRTKHSISNGFFADIRWFPYRKGVFAGKEINGKVARSWVRDRGGIAIVDRGFRIRPYGDQDDDWLDLVRDANTNRRTWRTDIAETHFPMTSVTRSNPALNPMINLPASHQLVGAVFVASSKSTLTANLDDLIPSTDREGFLHTAGFEQLKKYVRAGVEYLAHLDRNKGLDEKQQEAQRKVSDAKEEFRDALQYVQSLPSLNPVERTRIVKQYTELASRIDEVEEYDREARGKLSAMGALGVLAGFITHEATRLKDTLQKASTAVARAATKDPSLADLASELSSGAAVWNEQLEYVSMFVDATQAYKPIQFKAKPQVARVTRLFSQFCEDRNITVRNQIDSAVMSPKMPVSVYSGIVLNLLTNALKAVSAVEKPSAGRIVEIRAWTEQKRHFVEVLDTGIGVPPSMRKRVFDPLFTTTSRLDNSLGTGMGLGLSLSRQLAQEHGGDIELINPPEGFATCFRVTFQLG